MALPFQALTGKRTYQWGEEQERAFDELRKAMVRAPVLALHNATDLKSEHGSPQGFPY
jgi:hypothetical protein